MRLSLWNRKLHRWGSVLIAAPLLLVVLSGLLLQVKKDVLWVQPATQRGSAKEPKIGWDALLAAVSTVPEAGVRGWQDIARIDVQHRRGMCKVQCESGIEVQLDLATGAVLQTAYRRSDLIESLHDGSFFGEVVKSWVFLPSAGVLLLLWISGLYLFLQPHLARRRKRRAATR